MRFFQAQNCKRWPDLFEPFDTVGGILYGFCGTDNPEDLGKIEVLLSQPKLGVTEITEEECRRMAQKKTQGSGSSTQFRPRPVRSSVSIVDLVGGNDPSKSIPAISPAAAPLKGPGGMKIDTSGNAAPVEIEPEATTKPVPSLSEALQTGEVEPPPSAKPRNSRKTK